MFGLNNSPPYSAIYNSNLGLSEEAPPKAREAVVSFSNTRSNTDGLGNIPQLLCNGDPSDFNYLRYVGWSEDNWCIRKFFSPATVRLISRKVSQLTKGVDQHNRTIVVPDIRIAEVMDGVYQRFTPPTGDIFTRYIIPNSEQANMVQSLIDQTIEVIVSNIRGQLGIEEANRKLTVWTTVLGDFNEHGLRAHPVLKTLEKSPARMQFNMNY